MTGQNKELTELFVEEIRQSRRDHREGLEKLADALKSINETNVLHSERVDDLDGTVRANVSAINELATEIRVSNRVQRFFQFIIVLLIVVLIVVAGAERAFEYFTIIRIP